MEITKELKQDLSELESACSSFLGKYESQLTDALNKTKMSAEDSLKIDLMLELVTHLSSAQFVSSYMQKDIVKEVCSRMRPETSRSAAILFRR